jgi:hypothetical protein
MVRDSDPHPPLRAVRQTRSGAKAGKFFDAFPELDAAVEAIVEVQETGAWTAFGERRSDVA